jgi:hypothetical protein
MKYFEIAQETIRLHDLVLSVTDPRIRQQMVIS